MKLSKLLLAATLSISALPAADYYNNYDYGTGFESYNSFTTADGYKKYRVVSSTPITKTITKKVNIGNEIRERRVKRRVPCHNDTDTNSIGLDTIIGAGIGLAVGNRVGKGHGREAARVIGGLGGGYIANQMRNSGECYEDHVVYDRVPRYDTITEEIITGYNNCVEVDGRKLCKESKRKLKFLKVKKTYSIY